MNQTELIAKVKGIPVQKYIWWDGPNKITSTTPPVGTWGINKHTIEVTATLQITHVYLLERIK